MEQELQDRTNVVVDGGFDDNNIQEEEFFKEGDMGEGDLIVDNREDEAGEEEGDEIDFKKIGKTVSLCLSARTALFLPYKWSPPPTANSDDYINVSLKRKIKNAEGKDVDLWEENIRLPQATSDLDPHFRQTLGWREKNQLLRINAKNKKHFLNQNFEAQTNLEYEVEPDDVCRRLLLTDEALKILFPSPCLVATSGTPQPHQNASNNPHATPNVSNSDAVDRTDRICQPIIVERVEITLFPLGTAVLIIQLNWITNRAAVGPGHQRYFNPLSVEDLRTWLFLSKFRHKVVNLYEGWMLNDSPDEVKNESDLDHLKPLFGKAMLKSLFLKKPASLSTIGNWLLALPDQGENLEGPPKRLGRFAKRCYHHSLVVLDQEPDVKDLQEYLFHLRRAYGQTNRPPPTDLEKSTDTILRPRLNRYIAMSREGTIALSWPIAANYKVDFELTKWHKRFFGVFLLLAAHVQGEKSIIMELSNLSADAGTLLKQTLREDLLFDDLNRVRNQLFNTATLMTRFALQMSADDCGGLSEYVEFFSALRNMFRIRPQRNELREEIQDVLLLVENSYLEEERKNDESDIYLKSQEKKLTNLRNKRKLGGQKRFEKLVGAISSLSIPPVIISGIFGMNLYDTPVYLPFWHVIAFTIALSIVLLFIFIFMPKKQKTLDEVELKSHLKELSKNGRNVKRSLTNIISERSMKVV